MTDNELLLAISKLLDTKLEPIKNDVDILKKIVTEHIEKLQQIS